MAFKCPDCSTLFNTFSELLEHAAECIDKKQRMRTGASAGPPYQCPMCEKSYLSIELLRQHKLMRHGERETVEEGAVPKSTSFSDNHIGKMEEENSSVRTLENRGTNVKSVHSSLPKAFDGSSSFRPVRSQENNLPQDVTNVTSIKRVKNLVTRASHGVQPDRIGQLHDHKEQRRNRKVVRFAAFEEHVRIPRNSEQNVEEQGYSVPLNPPHVCWMKHCDREFSDPALARVHERKKHGLIQNSSTKHRVVSSSPHRVCMVHGCNRAFTTSAALRYHEEQTHGIFKEKINTRGGTLCRPLHVCRVKGCNKAYSTLAGIQNHEKSQHGLGETRLYRLKRKFREKFRY